MEAWAREGAGPGGRALLGKSGGKGGDNNKEGAATGAARGQFRLPAGALARPGCGGSGGDKAEPAAASGPKSRSAGMMRTVGGTAYLNSPTRLRSQPVTRSRSLPSRERQGPPVSLPLSTSCFPGDIPL
ncbi:AT-rich interactive domain-containing protein 1B-like [Mustela erminea]|uniref:AT-rich interactive domain-containing protein 1B-like n=1 Tax=Mustela erminea TaxID=36723 RepID=UPI001386CB60|nr:AT-rich interactive domain-containing protein 1B-like [Mustela erminea]